jgi:hypothetical protein
MGDARAAVVVLTCMALGGCVADELATNPRDASAHDSTLEPLLPPPLASFPAPTDQAASLHCDGSPLPPCPPGTTGPSCTLPCAVGSPTCSFELYCHGDGSAYGLAAIGALLYPSSLDASPAVLASELVGWITSHEQDLGLAPGLDESDLELVPADDRVARADALTIVRFHQRYRSRPVLPPDDLVQVVYSPAGAIQLAGRIIDARIDYDDHDTQAPASLALASIRHHAHVRSQTPISEIQVDAFTLVAMPQPRRVAWVGHARRSGGTPLARVIVTADADAPGRLLPLLSYRPLAAEDLARTVPIRVLTADPTTDPAAFGTSIETTLVDGTPLLGSIDDVSGQTQLATESVVVLDLRGGSLEHLDMVGTRILDPDGEFLATSGSAFGGQLTHHLLHGWYARIDAYLTDPASQTKHWDSAVPAYAPGARSPTPAGTFAPRMLALVASAASDCAATAVACASHAGYTWAHPAARAFPELVHQPPGTGPGAFEAIGRLSLPPAAEHGESIVTLSHEFGHVVDLFVGPGMTPHIAPDCAGDCTFDCVEDTSDEAPPLGETIAQMLGLLLLHSSFEPVSFEHCGIVGLFSRSNVEAFDPGPCVPAGEDVSVLERPGACTKSPEYCDKPTAVGFWLECCDPTIDADCIVQAPADCSTGFQRRVPTGLCHTSPGYDTHSVLQAFWQLLEGQRCEPTAPFQCSSSALAPGVAPADVVVPAFLHSLRLDPLSYEQLFDGMAAHVACVHGRDAYDEFNAVACAHGLRGCDDPLPVTCETCPNGVREGTETCDGLDWVVATCRDLGDFVGGELRCDEASCQLDTSLCVELDDTVDSTAGAGLDRETPSTDPAATATESGCACHSAPRRAHPWLLVLLACAAVRRRRAHRRPLLRSAPSRRSPWVRTSASSSSAPS